MTLQDDKTMRNIYNTLDSLVAGIWGITIIYSLPLFTINFINDWIKVGLALVGFFYMILIKIPNEVKASKLKRRIDTAQARKMELENEETVQEQQSKTK